MIYGKVWGTTSPLLETPFLAVHELTIKPYSTCSLHCHKFKWNCFYCRKGQLWIEVHKNDYDLVDITELGPGDFTTVKPGEYHLFRSHGETVKAIEMYYPEFLSEDIVRKNCGSTK